MWIVKNISGIWGGPISATGVLACKYAGKLSNGDTIFALNRNGSLAERRHLDGDTLVVLAAAVCQHDFKLDEPYEGPALSKGERKVIFAVLSKVLTANLREARADIVDAFVESVVGNDFSLRPLEGRLGWDASVDVGESQHHLAQILAFTASIRFLRFEHRFAGKDIGLRKAVETAALLTFVARVHDVTCPPMAPRFPTRWVQRALLSTFDDFCALFSPSATPAGAYAVNLAIDFLTSDDQQVWAQALTTIAVGGGDEPFSGEAALETDGSCFIGRAWALRHGVKRNTDAIASELQTWRGDSEASVLSATAAAIKEVADQLAMQLAAAVCANKPN